MVGSSGMLRPRALLQTPAKETGNHLCSSVSVLRSTADVSASRGKETFAPAVTALCGSPVGSEGCVGLRQPCVKAAGRTPGPPPRLSLLSFGVPACSARLVLCACRKEETVTIYPADVVLFEGILAFYSQEVRDLFQMKLFVDTDADTRLSRRGALAKPPWPCWWPVTGPCTPRSEAHAFPEVAPGCPAARVSADL